MHRNHRAAAATMALALGLCACSTRVGILGRLPHDGSCDGSCTTATIDASDDAQSTGPDASSDADAGIDAGNDAAGDAQSSCDGGGCPDRWVWVAHFGDESSQSASAIASAPIGTSVIGGRLPGLADFGHGTIGSASADADGFVSFLEYSPSFSARWAHAYGAAGNDTVTSVALDANDSVVVTGSFASGIDFGAGALSHVGGEDIFFAKLTSQGAHVFSKAFGSAGDEHAHDVVVGPSDEIVLVGSLGPDAVDFGSGDRTSAGGTDAFVARFDADGNPTWSFVLGDAADQVATSAAIQVWPTAPSGHVIVGGTFSGVIDLAAGDLTSAGGSDGFLIGFDAAGNSIWTERFGDALDQRVSSVAVDPLSGLIAVTGAFQGTLDFGCGPLTSAGGWDGFLAIFAPGDFHVWCAFSTRFGDAADQQGLGVAYDFSGNVVVVGDFHGSIELGDFAATSHGGADLFAFKMTPNAEIAWLETAGDASDQSLTGVAVDSSNRIRVVGTIAGSSTFDGETITVPGPAGSTDVFVGELRP